MWSFDPQDDSSVTEVIVWSFDPQDDSSVTEVIAWPGRQQCHRGHCVVV